MYYELTDSFEVTADEEKTWAFFSSAENLPAITPPWLGFTILTPSPVVIQNDSILDYTVRWMKLPIHWRTRIIDWTPTKQFIDLQIKGPYTLWHHQHTFTPIASAQGGGIHCTDRVIYKLPMGILGRPMHPFLIRKQLLEIFRFRRSAIAKSLGWKRAVQEDVEIRTLG